MKYVRCITPGWENYYGIHPGKVYAVQKEGVALFAGVGGDTRTYFLKTKVGPTEFYQRDFTVVGGCPCSVKNCISKHKEEK
jgi:hypothetical protein